MDLIYMDLLWMPFIINRRNQSKEDIKEKKEKNTATEFFL